MFGPGLGMGLKHQIWVHVFIFPRRCFLLYRYCDRDVNQILYTFPTSDSHARLHPCFDPKPLGPVVQSVVSLTSSLRVISLTGLADSIYNSLIFFPQKKIQHICVSLNVNFNESLTNDVVSFEQLGPGVPVGTSGVGSQSMSSCTV